MQVVAVSTRWPSSSWRVIVCKGLSKRKLEVFGARACLQEAVAKPEWQEGEGSGSASSEFRSTEHGAQRGGRRGLQRQGAEGRHTRRHSEDFDSRGVLNRQAHST